MPELCRFYGIVITMYYDDKERHHTPHVHIQYGDYKATMDFNGNLLVGELPAKEIRIVSAWIAIHEDELKAAWDRAVDRKEIGKIAPLN